jgi:hypothetical protein
MKLNDLLTDLFELNNEKSDFLKIDTLDNKSLLNIKQYLLECDELKTIENFNIIEIPDVENEKGKIIESKTFKLTGDVKFGNKCYIHSISMSPEIFNPDTIHKPVKDGVCITPTVYDPKSFKPTKQICIEFSPEEIQDDLLNNEGKKKEELIELFKKVLDSPDEYRVKGERSFIIRGIFDEITINGETYKEEIGNLNLDYNNQKHFMVMYFNNILNDDNTISIKLDKKYLPNNMKDSFIKKFENKKTVTKEELDEFLKSFETKS